MDNEDLDARAEGFVSYATIAALFFGFGVTILWEECSRSQPDRSPVVAILVTIAVASSSYSLAVLSINHYIMKQLRYGRFTAAQRQGYISKSELGRTVARYMLWLSLAMFNFASCVHVYQSFRASSVGLWCALILGATTALTVATAYRLRLYYVIGAGGDDGTDDGSDGRAEFPAAGRTLKSE